MGHLLYQHCAQLADLAPCLLSHHVGNDQYYFSEDLRFDTHHCLIPAALATPACEALPPRLVVPAVDEEWTLLEDSRPQNFTLAIYEFKVCRRPPKRFLYAIV